MRVDGPGTSRNLKDSTNSAATISIGPPYAASGRDLSRGRPRLRTHVAGPEVGAERDEVGTPARGSARGRRGRAAVPASAVAAWSAASSATPQRSTTLRTAVSIVSAEPASVPSARRRWPSNILSAVPPTVPRPHATASVTSTTCRALRREGEADRGGVNVHEVGDDGDREPVVGERGADQAGLAVVQRAHPVEAVRDEPGAGVCRVVPARTTRSSVRATRPRPSLGTPRSRRSRASLSGASVVSLTTSGSAASQSGRAGR